MYKKILIFSKVFVLQFVFCLSVLGQKDISVDARTGKADISIPLGQVVSKDIILPIVLAYNSSGMKVSGWSSEAEQWGRNWMLNSEYKVNRVLKGLPDEFSSTLKKGWLKNNSSSLTAAYIPVSDQNTSTCSDEQTDFNELTSSMQYMDTEPDEFFFSLPGGTSGKFVFDNTGTVRTIPYMDIKINADLDAGFILMTTNDGRKYYFLANKEVIVSVSSSATLPNTLRRDYLLLKQESPTEKVKYVISWHLSSMSSPKGGTVLFNYKKNIGNIADTVKTPVSIATEHHLVDTLYTILGQVNYEHELVGISGSNNMSFTSSVNGKIINFTGFGPSKHFMLDIVKVKSVVPPSGTAEGTFKILKSVKEISGCSAFPPYELEYYAINWNDSTSYFPPQDSFGQDAWGFYNGELTNFSLTPKVYVYNSALNFQKYRPSSLQYPGYDNVISGNSREVDDVAIVYGSLKKMTFPAGGSAELTYEPNDFYDSTANLKFKGMGIRVKKIVISDGIGGDNDQTTEYSYLDVNGQSSGSLTSVPNFVIAGTDSIYRSPTNLSDETLVFYNRMTMKQTGKGKTVFEFQNDATFPSLTYANPVSTAYNWSASYAVIVRDGCTDAGKIMTGHYTFPFVDNPNYDFNRNLLRKKIIYDENGNIVKEHQFDYSYLTPGLVAIKGLKFDFVDGSILLGSYHLFSQLNTVIEAEREYTRDPITGLLVLSHEKKHYYDSPNHKLLSRTTTSNSDGSLSELKYKYVADFGNIINPNDDYTYAIKWMNDNYMKSILIETTQAVIRGSNKVILSASLSKFKKFGKLEALPAQTLKYYGGASFVEAALQTISGTQKLVNDINYKVEDQVLVYDEYYPIQTLNKIRQIKSYVMDHKSDMPYIALENADPTQVAFSDFDTYWANSFDTYEGPDLSPGYSGQNSIQFTSGLFKNVVKASSDRYRVSFWYKSDTSDDMYFMFSSQTAYAEELLTIPSSSGKWRFFEKEFDLSAFLTNQLFNIMMVKLNGNYEINMDNVAFYPANAKITTFSNIPGIGKSYEINSSGRAVFYDYDSFGRLSHVKDRDKNILKRIEYQLRSQPNPVLKSDFTISAVDGKIITDEEVTFNSNESCYTNAQHQWYVNNILVSSSNFYIYQAPSVAPSTPVVVRHVVTHPAYGTSETTKHLIITPRVIYAQLILTGGSPIINTCASSYVRTFVASYYGCKPETAMNFYWEIKYPGQPWTAMTSTDYWAEVCGLEYSIRVTVSGCGLSTVSNEIQISYTGNCPARTCPN